MYQLYAFFHKNSVDMQTIDAYLDLLPPERRVRALRYRNERNRLNCIISYLLLRHALKTEFSLHDPRIAAAENGKPFLPDHPNVHFNISHCPAGCVVGVADRPIGVDIQDIRHFSPRLREYCCSRDELALLSRCAQPEVEFTGLWAMKESYLKLIGCGITGRPNTVDTMKFQHLVHLTRREDCFIAVSMEKT